MRFENRPLVRQGSKRFGRIFGFAVQNVAADAGIVYAADLADTVGFVSFESPQTAVYSFTAVNSEDAPWEIYVLDEPFTDAERYIPQAYACALTGDGSLLVEAGKWIYIHCPYNGFTGETAPEGCALSWTSIHA